VLESPGASGRLVRDVLLRDGSTLRLQAPSRADYEDIRAFYEQLSPQSSYFRFHGIGRADLVARAAVESSGIDRVSLIARHGGRVIAACNSPWRFCLESPEAWWAIRIACGKFSSTLLGTR